MFSLSLFALAATFFGSTTNAGGTNFGATSSAQACSLSKTPKTTGYDLRLFEYDHDDVNDFHTDDYIDRGYQSKPLIGETKGFNYITASGSYATDNIVKGTVYGINTQMTNFTAEFTSYFYAKTSGYYEVLFHDVDDSAALFFASEDAFVCCTPEEIPDGDLEYNILTYKSWDGSVDSDQFYYQYLEEGYYYPLRIVFTNANGPYSITFTITTPEGNKVSDASSGYLFSPASVDDKSCCANSISTVDVTTSSSWTGSVTSVSTYYPSGTEGVTVVTLIPDPTTTVTAYYDGPTISSTFVTPTGAGTWTESVFYPETTITSYVPWTGTKTVTKTTIIPDNPETPATVVIETPDAITTTTIPWTGTKESSSTIYPPEGQYGTVTVEILTPRETATSYVPWTGSNTVTSTTIIPTDSEIPATVVIEIPDAITTTTIPWTGAGISTTVIYPPEGKNGTVTVEVLTPREVVTSTTLWTGAFTSTYTTFTAENSDGTITVGVEIPRGTETVTDFWSGSTTSYTTEFPSDLNSEVTVHEYIPQSVVSGDIVYITTYWTGDFISYSTANPGYSNGTTTVFVDIPQQVITETWSGVVTSTTFYCPYSGAASTPVVLVPSEIPTTGYSENCESCAFGSSSSSTYIESSESFSSTPSSEYGSSSGSLTESSGSSFAPSSEYGSSSDSLTESFGSSFAPSSEYGSSSESLTESFGSSSAPSSGYVSSGYVSSSSSLTESSGYSISTPDVGINYLSSGNRLLSLNSVSIISILFILSIAI